jgi:hypothetical protein
MIPIEKMVIIGFICGLFFISFLLSIIILYFVAWSNDEAFPYKALGQAWTIMTFIVTIILILILAWK